MKKYLIPLTVLIITVIAGLTFFNKGATSDVIPTSSLTETYKNPYFFSFQHASTTHIEEALNEQGGTIIVNGAQGNFQVYLSPYDEDASTLTQERLLKDIPDLKIKDAKPYIVTDGVQGIAFISEDLNAKETQEIWFVSKGFLYQTSALVESTAFLEETLETWKVVD
jgi:hypothetical protein